MLKIEIKNILICPSCGGKIIFGNNLACERCAKKYPVIEEIPILIDSEKSIFQTEDFIDRRPTTVNLSIYKRGFFRRNLKKIIPSITKNLKAKDNLKTLGELLLNFNSQPIVLIVGGSILGAGIEEFIQNKNITFIETDVSFGPKTQIMCDAHKLPFAAESIDAVIVQAVLEHVVDPYICVEEIYRVLKLGGLVYSETPFMQQVHMGKYDFTRFTDLGHRYLFKKFEEIERGIVEGPGTALAWSIQYFLTSFTKSRNLKKIIGIISSFFIFWLKYFDCYLIHNVSSYEGASGFYFMGRKSNKFLSDRELIELYRGIK